MKGFNFILFICGILIILSISCTLKDFQDWNVHERLGSNYYIDRECRGLIYGDGINGGLVVIDQGIIDYAFDDRWIIAKTRILCGYHKIIPDSLPSDSITDYWIIDKSVKLDLEKESTQGTIYRLETPFADPSYKNSWTRLDGVITKNVAGPLDSVYFYTLLKEKAITLSFKERKK